MSENQKIIPASMYSPELFSLVLEQSPLAILVTDASGIALWENDSYRRLFNEGNGSPSACKYDLFKDELINEQGFAGELKKTFLSGQVSTFILEKPQCTDTAKDTQQILQTTILPLKDPAGNVVNAVVRYQDITINQQRERELIEKLKNYESIYNTTSSGVIIYETGDGGKSFIIKDMNRASESIEHLQREDVIGKSPSEVFPGADESGLYSLVKRVWQTGIPEYFPATFYHDRRINGWVESHIFKLASGEVVMVFDDITERKQAEEALKKNVEQFKVLTESSYDIIVVFTIDGNFSYIAPSCEKFLQYKPEEMIGKSMMEFIMPYDLIRVQEAMELILGGKDLFDITIDVRKKDGSVCPLEVRGTPVYAKGTMTAIQGTARDVTDRIRAEKEIARRESFQKLAATISSEFINLPPEQIDEGINRAMEAVGKFYDAHCAFLVLFPQNNAKLTPSHYWCAEASASPESSPVDFNTIAEVIKSGHTYNVTDIENRQNGANPGSKALGTGSIASVIAVPLISYKTVIGFTGLMTTVKQRTWPDDINVLMQMAGQIFTNVLDRRNSEHALRDSEQKYRSLLENIQEGIISVNSTGAIEFINERAANMLGYKVEEMIGASLLTFMYRENIKNATTQLRQRQQGLTGEFDQDFTHKDGGTVHTHIKVSPVFDNQGNFSTTIGTINDITAIKQAQQEREQHIQKLLSVMRSVIDAMVLTVEKRDVYTAGHQRRVADLAVAIAQKMGLSQDFIDGLFMAGIIHDIGKMYVPSEILSKPGRLNEIEYSMVKIHPEAGFEILQSIEFPWPIAQIVRQHHERMNGSGYPGGLKGEDILLEARILAVADTVEAMASHRPYRPALGIEAALDEITLCKNTLYDASVVDACVTLFKNSEFSLTAKSFSG